MLRVLIWNEFVHEITYPDVKEIYPDGIHKLIGRFLEAEGDMQCSYATLDMPNQGVTEEILANTDVLVWWSHARQELVTDETAELIKRHVHAGMGLVVLHSGHFSKPFRALMGTPCTLGWREGDSERLWVVDPSHPICAGIPPVVEIPVEEMYSEPFAIPKPDDVVFLGWFRGGEAIRAGVTFQRGLGRIFWFQPGHEQNPTYKIPEVQRIITNAVRWAAPRVRLPEPQDNVERVGDMRL